MTEQVYRGDSLVGVVETDALCQKAATDALLPGDFMAWFSDGALSPNTRFKSNDFSGWYRLVDGPAIAHGWTELTNGQELYNPIMTTAFGDTVSVLDAPYAWTGTEHDGTQNLNDCGSWESGPFGLIGKIGVNSSEWTSYKFSTCDLKARLYCFQVPPRTD